MSDPAPTPSAGGLPTRRFTRRSLLVGALAATALTAGCTGSRADDADAVTPEQVDQLTEQVRVQEGLVAAYDRAFAAAPDLAAGAAVLADQARAQLDRLRAAAPGSTSGSASGASASASASTPTAEPPVDPAGAGPYLRAQVAAAAAAHGTACPAFTGGRAALLGSIAAGLRGQDGELA